MTLQEKLNCLICTGDWSLQAIVTCHFKINESSLRTIVEEKEIGEAVAAVIPAGTKILHFLWNTFYLILKMQLLYVCRVSIRKAYLYTLIWLEKKQSHYVTKQKEGKRPKAGEFNASKGWFDTLIKQFDLKKKSQDNRRSSLCQPKDSRQVPRCH